MTSSDEDMVMPQTLKILLHPCRGISVCYGPKGWAKSAMTGSLSIPFLRARDPWRELDYIVGLAWKFGVTTKFEWVMVSGAKLACTVVVNVTTPGGGYTKH